MQSLRLCSTLVRGSCLALGFVGACTRPSIWVCGMFEGDPPLNLLGMTTAELEELAVELGQPSFRGRQIGGWLYKRQAVRIGDMTDLPADLRRSLARRTVLQRSQTVAVTTAPDSTAKLLLKMADGHLVESVLLPYEQRVSVCVSSQVGCAVGCTFCATAMGGLVRNLSAGEIVDQVLTLQSQSPRRISHVVYMGMGEPLLNYENVLRSIRILNEEVGIAMRHISVSTVGITPRIERLARQKLQLTLAVSLHSPNEELRRKLIPISERYPLSELIRACARYADMTHRRVTFEYLLLGGVNDSLPLAGELASLLRGILCNVNLIPYNPVEGISRSRPSPGRAKAFRSVLEQGGITVTQRLERGHALSAACGQLRLRSAPLDL